MKKVHRFYVPEVELNNMLCIEGNENPVSGSVSSGITFTYSGEHVNQFLHVLRFQPGNQVILFNEVSGELLCEFILCNKKEITLSILSHELKNEKPFCEISVFAPLLKKEPFDFMLEKLTEVGVSNIVPFVSTHTQVGELNKVRAQKIVIEATEQSGRVQPPHIENLIHIDDKEMIKKRFLDLDYVLILHPYDVGNEVEGLTIPNKNTLYSTLSNLIKESEIGHETQQERDELTKKTKLKDRVRVGLLIGPEGGLSSSEVKDLSFICPSQTHIVSMGQTILRAETAAIISSSLVLQGFATLVRS